MAFPLNDQVYTKSFTPREYEVSYFDMIKNLKNIRKCKCTLAHTHTHTHTYIYIYIYIYTYTHVNICL